MQTPDKDFLVRDDGDDEDVGDLKGVEEFEIIRSGTPTPSQVKVDGGPPLKLSPPTDS